MTDDEPRKSRERPMSPPSTRMALAPVLCLRRPHYYRSTTTTSTVASGVRGVCGARHPSPEPPSRTDQSERARALTSHAMTRTGNAMICVSPHQQERKRERDVREEKKRSLENQGSFTRFSFVTFFFLLLLYLPSRFLERRIGCDWLPAVCVCECVCVSEADWARGTHRRRRLPFWNRPVWKDRDPPKDTRARTPCHTRTPHSKRTETEEEGRDSRRTSSSSTEHTLPPCGGAY